MNPLLWILSLGHLVVDLGQGVLSVSFRFLEFYLLSPSRMFELEKQLQDYKPEVLRAS